MINQGFVLYLKKKINDLDTVVTNTANKINGQLSLFIPWPTVLVRLCPNRKYLEHLLTEKNGAISEYVKNEWKVDEITYFKETVSPISSLSFPLQEPF